MNHQRKDQKTTKTTNETTKESLTKVPKNIKEPSNNNQQNTKRDPRLLNAEVDNSILMQQLFDIQENKQKSNIFYAKSFIQACKIIQNEKIDECSSESDDEMEDDYEQ
ncbi:2289_t:CDS:2, partial [Funneliformis caledonium]